MRKAQLTRVELELARAGPSAIQGVAYDGNPQPQFVGGMDAQLMGPPRHRHEGNSRPILFNGHTLPVGDTQLSLLRVVDLTGPILKIQTKRKFNGSGFTFEPPIKERNVAFSRSA